jgi:tetratricopeptide (TPR) repeat protein
MGLLVIFAMLLAGGFLLMHYLSKNPIGPEAPKDISPSRPPSTSPAKSVAKAPEPPAGKKDAKPPAPASGEEMEAAKRGADKGLTDFIRAREELDAMGGAQWGGATYSRMEEAARQADAFYLKKEYGPALTRYRQALAMVTAVRGEAPDALIRVMAEGGQALAAGDGKRAGERFALALKIDPTSRGAQKGLARAEKAEAVARFLASGKRHETRKKLAFALADYDQARKLDPASDRAQKAYQRVKDLIAEEAFRKHMSTGLTALHKGDFEGARVALGKARGLRPDSLEVGEALVQVDQAERLAKIKRYQMEALDAEQSEDWERALAAYRAVLEIDPMVRFAVLGKERSLRMNQVSKRVAFYLDKPEVLASETYLDKAVQLLAEANGMNAIGPRLKTRVEKLRHLVQTAQIPLKITLESDNFTQVAVYKVGRLGTFLKKDLALRPGTYTIVGTRSGYKDVRQQVVIKPGQPLRVTIICREKIS